MRATQRIRGVCVMALAVSCAQPLFAQIVGMSFPRGDVNVDGFVDVADSILLSQSLVWIGGAGLEKLRQELPDSVYGELNSD